MPQEKKKQKEVKLDNIYKRFPKLKNLGEVTLKADTSFTRDKTGAGDIEYFSPDTTGRQSIIYKMGTENEYEYKHPKPGTHGIVYNPDTNDEQGIALDMLHGMKDADTAYAHKRKVFAHTVMRSPYRFDFQRDWNEANKQPNDGYNAFFDNWIDGKIRSLLFKGTAEDYKKARYWPGEREMLFQNEGIKHSFTELENYLKSSE